MLVKNEDVVDGQVLKVPVDIYDTSKYEDFINELCSNREYQKEAIRNVIRFFLSNKYKNTEELAEENYNQNSLLQSLYSSISDFKKKLEFKDKLSCTIDLATATGKSWVMYGAAQIMMCEGVIDRVLVLCPSVTIEQELRRKFKLFATDKNLKSTLPHGSMIPDVMEFGASKTIGRGNICIENIHAVYERTGSSIKDSLRGKGQKTLIINDEAHHFMEGNLTEEGEEAKYLKKWKEFLISSEFNFKYIVNSTGTPYIGNNYFRDVVYRYSLRKAIDEKRVKLIYYNKDTKDLTSKEKLTAVYAIHEENRKKYRLKPITIFVTQKIKRAEEVAEDIKRFLLTKGIKDVEEKVIVVTSSPAHKKNLETLKTVDDSKNKVEWITSVSMLTEGWDVKNVFQIVPHEERAFNSKLLISQVLGRGLRIPLDFEKRNEQPTLTVFNHDKWSSNIEGYYYSVTEEQRIKSSIDPKSKFNFDLLIMEEKVGKKLTTITPKKGPIEFEKKYVDLDIQPEEKEVLFVSIKDSGELIYKFKPENTFFTIEEAADIVYREVILEYDAEYKTQYSKKFNRNFIKELIANSLKRINASKITEENLQRIKIAFNVLYKRETHNPRLEKFFTNPKAKSTKEMKESFVSVQSLYNDKCIIYAQEALKTNGENKKTIAQFLEDGKRPVDSIIEINEDREYKTPLDIIILNGNSEIKFGKLLVRKENSKFIDAWIKSRDVGFYTFPYIYRPGTHSISREFNPDFFIKIGNDILVVEIKTEQDKSDANKAKARSAKKYFNELNKKQSKYKYYFYFLSDFYFNEFFEKIRSKKYKDYKSKYHLELEGK